MSDVVTAAPATPTSNLTITDLTAAGLNTNATIQVGLSKNAVPFVSGGGSGLVPGVTTTPTPGDQVSGWIVQDTAWGGQASPPPGTPDITLSGNGPPIAIPLPLKGTKIVWQRTSVSVGAPSINVLISGQVAASGANPLGAYVNNGNSFGSNANIGPIDAFPFQVGGLGVSTTTTVTAVAGNNVFVTSTGASGVVVSGGTGTSSFSIGAGGTLNLGTNATDHTTNIGSGTSVSAFGLSAGSGGILGTTNTNGPITLNANGTGGFTVTVGTGSTANYGVTTDHTSVLGSITGVSPTTVQGGTTGVTVGGALVQGRSVAILDGTGTLGSAATTVDVTGRLVVTQTTAVVTQANMRLLQPPTVTTAGRRCVVQSSTSSTASFTVGDATLKQGVNLNPGEACEFMWDGAAWGPLACTQQDPVQGAALTDAAATSARAGQITQYTLPAATLSAGRTNTLSTVGAIKGDVMIITRLDVTANTYTVVGAATTVMVASKQNGCTLRFDGTAWQFLTIGPT